MQQVYLSDSGPKVSEAIYGFWRWKNEGLVTSEKLAKTVTYCLDLGINTFDHANHYGEGYIEQYFGNLFICNKIKRSDVVLFSKAGLQRSASGFTYYNASKQYLLDAVDASLQRLCTDYLDVFLLEGIDHLSNIESTAEALELLVKQGKIRSIGLSNVNVFRHQQLASILSVPIVTNHIELNLLNTTALDDGRVDFIKQRFSKPLVSAPLADGEILFGTDARTVLLRNRLESLAQKYAAHVEEIAVAWLFQLGTLPIIGSLEEQRIKHAASAAKIKLTHEEWNELYQIGAIKV
ncbi:MAG: aldo/keto reductase [Ferruginibacter sp.]